MQAPRSGIPRKVYSVSQLTDKIKSLLEEQYAMVWLAGEISNMRIPPSGHAYFTLKDAKAQISAVMFRGQMRNLKFGLDDGMMIVGLGRVSVYPPRGNYQIIIEYVEPQGAGALQLAFEQLKRKLQDEGLFSEKYKQPLPFIPKSIGVVTSPTGSVIRDIIKVLKRRYPNMPMDIYPVRVQGVEAAGEIVQAIEFANKLRRNDLIIVARGGGSMEDLSPFNDESVCRSIFHSDIPVVSAIGHETDYTISDFVADWRAPTPSAAAEISVPVMADIQARLVELRHRSQRAMIARCDQLRHQLMQVSRLIVHPGKKIQDMRLHIDRLEESARTNMVILVRDRKNRLEKARSGLMNNSPANRLELYKEKVDVLRYKLLQTLRNRIEINTERFKAAEALLGAVNPTAILQRGYSITRTLPEGKVVMDATGMNPGQLLEIQLAKGKVDVSVILPKANNKTEE